MASPCSDILAQCPKYTFECPSETGGGCCPVGLWCANDLCFEYEYKTLAVVPLYEVHPFDQESENNAPAEVTAMPSGLFQVADVVGGQDIPITERILATPTAWRAKIGEVALASEANEDGIAKARKESFHGAKSAVFGVLMVALIMLAL